MPQLDIVENFADGTVLTQAQLHQAFLSVEDFVNLVKLDEENIQPGSITNQSIADSTIITSKYQTASIILAKLAQDVVDKLLPSGVTVPFAGTAVPSGWLYCDGSAISRTVYAALFAAIGTLHGNGDGSSTFNIPDLKGRFIRGQDDGAGRDPYAGTRTASQVGGATGDSVGSVFGFVTAVPQVTAGFTTSGTTSGQSNTHTHIYNDGGAHAGSNIANGGNIAVNFANTTGANQQDHTHTYSSGIVGGDLETAPISIYMRYIIKI